MRAIPLALFVLSLTACGGRSPADLQRTIGYTQQYTAQGQPIPDLAAQNRLSLQTNAPFTYLYKKPVTEKLLGDVSEDTDTDSDTVDTDDLIPAGFEESSEIFEENISEEEFIEEVAEEGDMIEKVSEISSVSLGKAANFTLENLEGETQSFSFPRSKPLILAIADQKGSSQMESWITPLYDRYGDKIDIHGVAELSAVPKFARGIARGIISGIVKQPIMLDWTGNVSSSFNSSKGMTNVYIISPDGEIMAKSNDEASLEKLKSLATAMDAVVN